MKSMIESLKNIANENPDGFTVYTTNLKPVKTGWVVAMKETQNCFGDEGLLKALEVAIKTSQVIGGWKEGKKFYWDAVMVIEDEAEAIHAGRKNEQIAIYNLEQNKVVYL